MKGAGAVMLQDMAYGGEVEFPLFVNVRRTKFIFGCLLI
jgi:hypothetical protein